MRRKSIIYLAGPIANCTDSEARDWRNRVMAELGDHYGFRNPMGRDMRFANETRELQIEHSVEATRADKKAIGECNILLAYMPKPSQGTAMELMHASYSKHTCIVVAPLSHKLSLWVPAHCDFIYETFDEAIELLKTNAL